ncbi:MAG: DsrE family protein [Pseudomonadota bacterium]
MTNLRFFWVGAMLIFISHGSQAAEFAKGPLIKDYGPVASVPDNRIGSQSVFRVAFDIAEAARRGKVNRSMESAARFLNMHAAAGVPADNLSVALVIHGPAALDVVNSSRFGGENPNAGLVSALIEAGVTIELCGQTAAARGISSSDLLPGVEMSLSAITAHALLQQRGYTLNPF